MKRATLRRLSKLERMYQKLCAWFVEQSEEERALLLSLISLLMVVLCRVIWEVTKLYFSYQ